MKQIGNIIRYLIIVILDIAIMLVFHSYLNFLILVGLVIFPIFSVYSVYKVRSAFSMQLMLPLEPMNKGNEILLRVIAYNPTWFPLLNATVTLNVENTFHGEKGQHTLNFPVRAKKDTEVQYPIVMDYSGRFLVNAKQISFVDLLGICELKMDLNESAECLILPSGVLRNQEAGHIYINGVTEAMESKEKGYDFSEVSGIREYIPGDKLQNIHWKLSVKKDELMVKERVSVSAMQLHVLVELSNDEQMRVDAVLDLADSITKSFVAQNLPFTVYYYSSNLQELESCYIGNEKERIQWLEMMLYNKCYNEVGMVEQRFLESYAGGGAYLYIGFAGGSEITDNMMFGEKDSVAVLRRCSY